MTDYTSEQLAALKQAYASGTLRVTYEGKTVEYRSLDEIARAINTVSRELDKAGGTKRARQVRLRSSRGL